MLSEIAREEFSAVLDAVADVGLGCQFVQPIVQVFQQ